MYKNNRIKKIRTDKNISAKKIADYLGVSVQTVFEWERGNRNIPLTTLSKIASFLECKIYDLTGEQLTSTQIFIREALKDKETTLKELAEEIKVPETELKYLYDNKQGCSFDTLVKFYVSIGISSLKEIGEIVLNDMKINAVFNNKYMCTYEDKVLKECSEADYYKRLNETIEIALKNAPNLNLDKKNILEIDISGLSEGEIEDIKKYIEFIKFKKGSCTCNSI